MFTQGYIPSFAGFLADFIWFYSLFFLLVITPLHLFAMFVFVYIPIIIVKELKSIEMQRDVVFKEYVKDFVLFALFFPIGVWWLQPRINKIFKNEKH